MKQYISVTDAWTTLSSPDYFGKVSDGLLSLACSVLVQARLLGAVKFEEISDEDETHHYQYVRVNGAKERFPVFIDALSDEGDCDEVYLLPIYGGSWGSRRARTRAQSDGEPNDDMKEHEFDEANASDDPEEEWEDQMTICGLVLRACGQNTGDGGRFCRLGSFNLRNFDLYPNVDEDPERDYYEEFVQALDGRGHELADTKRPTEPMDNGYVQRNLNITVE
ncbi:unnamed protein product [Colletotrichum noveboracense]|uniref:Uncharacterized protein n=1 Tax=Colletotrichum noveboracense TaxID=2664923 RepID=A0A9W4WKN3_9PEZI|nr:unnamed protein product [Colletotrichum noveboracense]